MVVVQKAAWFVADNAQHCAQRREADGQGATEWEGNRGPRLWCRSQALA